MNGMSLGSRRRSSGLSETWPRITVVTPSFHQRQFLERTIRSVLDQGYPNMEYIVIDGGSTDGSVELIRRYASRLAYWASEPDRGQSHAINKGFLRGTGAILASLNSDDTYESGALEAIGRFFREHPEIDVVYGNAQLIDAEDRVVREIRDTGFNRQALMYGTFNIAPQCTFYRRELFFGVGMLREDLFCAMDYDLLLRFCVRGARFAHLRRTLGNFRLLEMSKTSKYWHVAKEEVQRLRRELCGMDDQSLSFRLWRALYTVRRAMHFIRQGQGCYVFGRVVSRM